MTGTRGVPAPPSPSGRRLRCDTTRHHHSSIRQTQPTKTTDARWGHFKPSRRGQRKPSLRRGVTRGCAYDWPQGSPYPADAPGSVNPYVKFPCPLPRPTLNGMRMRLTGHDAGANYYVRVTVRLRICAPRQRMTATFQERKTLGSTTFGRYARSVAFSHAGGCRWRTMKWKLRDEFFGIGTYSVTGQLFDSQGKTSRRLTRRSVTND